MTNRSIHHNPIIAFVLTVTLLLNPPIAMAANDSSKVTISDKVRLVITSNALKKNISLFKEAVREVSKEYTKMKKDIDFVEFSKVSLKINAKSHNIDVVKDRKKIGSITELNLKDGWIVFNGTKYFAKDFKRGDATASIWQTILFPKANAQIGVIEVTLGVLVLCMLAAMGWRAGSGVFKDIFTGSANRSCQDWLNKFISGISGLIQECAKVPELKKYTGPKSENISSRGSLVSNFQGIDTHEEIVRYFLATRLSSRDLQDNLKNIPQPSHLGRGFYEIKNLGEQYCMESSGSHRRATERSGAGYNWAFDEGGARFKEGMRNGFRGGRISGGPWEHEEIPQLKFPLADIISSYPDAMLACAQKLDSSNSQGKSSIDEGTNGHVAPKTVN